MRTRSSADLPTTFRSIWQCVPHNPGWHRDTVVSQGPRVSSRSIIDNPDISKREKPCKHTRNVFSYYPIPQIITGYCQTAFGYNTPATDRYYNSTRAPEYMNTLCQDLSRYNLRKPPSGLPTLSSVPLGVKQDALQRMLPKVNDGLSLINFVLELKDLRRMFNFETAERLLGSFNVWNQKRSQRIGVSSISSDFLNYQFGWKPFIGDLTSMVKALRGLNKRLDYLVANAGKPIRRHTSTLLSGINPLAPDFQQSFTVSQIYTASMQPNNGKLAVYSSKCRWVYAPRYHATIVYTYTLPRVSETRRKVRAYLDAFGVRFDPSIIWNAIPFSFVVDWVIDVGSWLRQFTPNDLGMETVIHDFSHSVKYHHIADVTGSIPQAYSVNNIEIPLITEEVSYYERGLDIPSMSSLTVSTPTAMQFTLGGALVLSRKRGVRR